MYQQHTQKNLNIHVWVHMNPLCAHVIEKRNTLSWVFVYLFLYLNVSLTSEHHPRCCDITIQKLLSDSLKCDVFLWWYTKTDKGSYFAWLCVFIGFTVSLQGSHRGWRWATVLCASYWDCWCCWWSCPAPTSAALAHDPAHPWRVFAPTPTTKMIPLIGAIPLWNKQHFSISVLSSETVIYFVQFEILMFTTKQTRWMIKFKEKWKQNIHQV